MTHSDTCGWETVDGGSCANPPTDGDTCWIPSHGDPGAENPHGRPSILDDHKDDILDGARQGMTLEGCARLAGIDESTLHRWITKYDEFRKSLKRARAQGELRHLRSVDERGSQFILERSFGYVKTEKREVEMDAEHSIDATEGVTAEFVTYDTDDDGDE